MAVKSHLIENTILVAPLFFISAYKSYKSFRHAESKIKLAKFILGLTLIVLALVALYSLAVAGLDGFALFYFVLAAILFAPGLIYGLLVGSTIGISVRVWSSGKKSQKAIITACWLFVFAAAVVYIALWQQDKAYRQKNQVKREMALDFVKHHSAVIEKVGANASPSLITIIPPKDFELNKGRLLLPVGYVILIDEDLYAIVSTPQDADDHRFTLDCITPLSDDELYEISIYRYHCKK